MLYGVKEYREDVFSKTVGLLLILLTSVEFIFLNMNYLYVCSEIAWRSHA